MSVSDQPRPLWLLFLNQFRRILPILSLLEFLHEALWDKLYLIQALSSYLSSVNFDQKFARRVAPPPVDKQSATTRSAPDSPTVCSAHQEGLGHNSVRNSHRCSQNCPVGTFAAIQPPLGD